FLYFFFFSSRRRHTRSKRDWSSDVCSSDLRLVLYTLWHFPIDSQILRRSTSDCDIAVYHQILPFQGGFPFSPVSHRLHPPHPEWSALSSYLALQIHQYFAPASPFSKETLQSSSAFQSVSAFYPQIPLSSPAPAHLSPEFPYKEKDSQAGFSAGETYWTPDFSPAPFPALHF